MPSSPCRRDKVLVRDLGSRNGTIVNGKALERLHGLEGSRPDPGRSADVRDLDPGDAGRGRGRPEPAPAKPKSPDDISHADIESWLVADAVSPTPERPSGVYGGDTQTISAYREDQASEPPDHVLPTKRKRNEEEDDQSRDERRGRERSGGATRREEEMIDDVEPIQQAQMQARGPRQARSQGFE